MVHLAHRVEHQLTHRRGRGAGLHRVTQRCSQGSIRIGRRVVVEGHTEELRRGLRDVDGLTRCTPMRDVAHRSELLTIVTGQQMLRHLRLIGLPLTAHIAIHHAQRLDGLRLWELILNPRIALLHVSRQRHCIRQVAIRELLHREASATAGHLRIQFRQALIRSVLLHSYHIEVLVPVGSLHPSSEGRSHARSPRIVLEVARGLKRLWQRHHQLLSALHVHLAPRQLLHGILGLHPRATRVAPSRGTGHSSLQSQRVGQRDGILKGILPLRRHVDQSLIHHLSRRQSRIERVEPSDACPMHPHQVLVDTILGDVTIHPVPPHTRTRLLWRVLEIIQQLLVELRLRTC